MRIWHERILIQYMGNQHIHVCRYQTENSSVMQSGFLQYFEHDRVLDVIVMFILTIF